MELTKVDLLARIVIYLVKLVLTPQQHAYLVILQLTYITTVAEAHVPMELI
jgi:hypothetical protein